MKKTALILSIFIVFLAGSLSAKDILTKDPGDKVSDFTIQNFDGKTYSTKDVKDAKALVVIFWSTKCPFVQAYNDRINDFVNEYQKKGFVIWAINSNNTESAGEVETHEKTNNYVFPVLKDEKSEVANMFEATKTPEVFVLDKDNVILYHGRIDDNQNKDEVTSHDLQNALDEIYNGKEVSVKSTKQFGCTIKKEKQSK